MKRLVRIALIVLNSFLALTAIAGGFGLLSGFARPPTELLDGSLFSSYVVPGLALAILVGGSASIATILIARNHPKARLASLAAAGAILIFEVVEVTVIGSPEGLARNLQMFYFQLGGAMLLFTLLYKISDQRSPQSH
jgi:hypothetical protein